MFGNLSYHFLSVKRISSTYYFRVGLFGDKILLMLPSYENDMMSYPFLEEYFCWIYKSILVFFFPPALGIFGATSLHPPWILMRIYSHLNGFYSVGKMVFLSCSFYNFFYLSFQKFDVSWISLGLFSVRFS